MYFTMQPVLFQWFLNPKSCVLRLNYFENFAKIRSLRKSGDATVVILKSNQVHVGLHQRYKFQGPTPAQIFAIVSELRFLGGKDTAKNLKISDIWDTFGTIPKDWVKQWSRNLNHRQGTSPTWFDLSTTTTVSPDFSTERSKHPKNTFTDQNGKKRTFWRSLWGRLRKHQR